MTKDTGLSDGLFAANDNEPQGKTCTKCGEWKVLTEFSYRARKNGELAPIPECKSCVYERVREWRARPGNRERKNEGERKRRKNPETKKKNNEYNKGWLARDGNRERLNAKDRARRKSDSAYREKTLKSQREYYRRPDIIEREKKKRKATYSTREWKDKFNSRRRERYRSDPGFLCAMKCRALVLRVAKKVKIKKNDATITLLGYSPDHLRQRLECQFQSGMTWSNHGEWHIDHKKPIAAFIAQGITDQRTINSLCNLQPMWGDENQEKSSAWPMVAANDNDKQVSSNAA